MQGAEERRLRRMSNTPQGEAIEGNAADDALMVNQGPGFRSFVVSPLPSQSFQEVRV
jgi:hypothetical protein